MASNIAVEKANESISIETGDIQIGAVEIKDGTTDARQAVKVDNATATATPTVAMVGAIYKDSLDTYGDNDASPLHTDVNGRLLVAATDNGGALTVDGTVSVTGLLPDGHNVTIDNAGAAAAVNIQDGGNTITVDGAVTVTNSTATNLKCEATVAASQTIAVTQDTATSLKSQTTIAGAVTTALATATEIAQAGTGYSDSLDISACRGYGGYLSALITVAEDGGAGTSFTITQQCSTDGTNWYDPVDTANGALGAVAATMTVGTRYARFSYVLTKYIRFKFVEGDVAAGKVSLTLITQN
jgi:hypothetical protein